jgi:bacillolysin
MQLMPIQGIAPLHGPVMPLAPAAAQSVVDPASLRGRRDPHAAGPRPGRQDGELLERAVDRVLAADERARIGVDPTSNVATFFSGEIGVVSRPGIGGSGPDRIARTFLAHHGALFGVHDSHAQLQLVGVDKDDLGFSHFRYQQVHQGLPVFGQQLVVHAREDRITAVGGHVVPNIASAEPQLRGQDAAQHALAATRRAIAADGETVPALHADGGQQLGWYTLQDGTPRLSYEVIVGGQADQRWQMYVDAETGELLDKWTLVHSALHRETVDARNGRIRREGDGPTGNQVIDVVHENTKGVYDFFKENFGRDSIDGKGMTLKSVVHYGNNYNNAFWNGRQMTYGDGDGVRFSPLGMAEDVVAHEMVHGITERTARLRYQRQSGALNESWSDVFGNLVEKWMERRAGLPESDPTWLIGEKIFTPGVAGDGLRSMSRPGTGHSRDPQPGHMRDYKETSSDNGGVHINSGIPNKAAYEAAMAIGQDKLAAVWYRALTTYMTATTQFRDAANFTVQSAIDLYGAGSAEARAIARAWDSVGLAPSVKPGVTAAAA